MAKTLSFCVSLCVSPQISKMYSGNTHPKCSHYIKANLSMFLDALMK